MSSRMNWERANREYRQRDTTRESWDRTDKNGKPVTLKDHPKQPFDVENRAWRTSMTMRKLKKERVYLGWRKKDDQED